MTFSGKLQTQSWMIQPETRRVMDALIENGGDARFVGGCVRNALANRPVFDIDIATPLKPDAVIERLKQHKIAYAPTGLRHGTVTAIVDGHPFEVTTLRVDAATDGRHAEVAFTDDWRTDASRRDFTFNALYATIDGDLFDPFGGVEDLRVGRVRFVGDAAQRIHEDVLRILRFFRFHAHFGKGEPGVEAIKSCKDAAGEIPKLSAERIRQEILKLLEADNCADAWQLMIDSGIVAQFLPDAKNVTALKNLMKLSAKYDAQPLALRRLAALLEGTAEHAAHKLKLSNDQAAQLSLMMDRALAPKDEAAVKKLIYKLGNDTARNSLLLAAARSGDESPLKALYKLATDFTPPAFPLRGDDVLKTGIKPGPDVGKILEGIESWWISEDFKPDRTACLARLNTKN